METKRTKNYSLILKGLKEKIKQARLKASLTVNTQLLEMYWEIGKTINYQEKSKGWGARIVEILARDLKVAFPDMQGLSSRNLRYMRDFAKAYPDFLILQPLAAKLVSERKTRFQNKKTASKNPQIKCLPHPASLIPWTHNQVILDKVKKESERLFYLQKTRENGWSKTVLALQIESNLFRRQGKAITNFKNTLPESDSDLANETLKNPFVFDFLSLGPESRERDIENALIQHMKKFLLELGRGFAYVGNQFNLNLEGNDFFLDLLFFNYNLNCFVIFELKVDVFKPEYVGKLNFAINVVNDKVKTEYQKPTLGVLLCKTPNKTVVQFALQGITSPIGVADYEYKKVLTKEFKAEMPTVQELEGELEREYKDFKKMQLKATMKRK
ncbi:MAG: DUF1016 domain-containing protein [Bacteroidia bacterium]|nr:DUF1016 domain-containing protein [Bacteroidia bacterium]